MTTIQEIDRDDQGDPPPGSTALVQRCVRLRRKPLGQFTAEDLRVMLGQEIAVPILLPLAVAALGKDPLAEGDLYPGDLLVAALSLPASAWTARQRDRDRLLAAVDPDDAELPRAVRDTVLAARGQQVRR